MSMFRRLMASTGLAAVAAATPGLAAGGEAPADAPANGPAGLTEAQMETITTAAHAEGLTAGATAERERTNAVLTSEAGKANMSMAAWMLNANPTATADSIITQLGTAPAAPAPAAAAATPAAPAADAQTPPITAPLSGAPILDLGAEHRDGDHDKAETKAETDKYIDTAITDASAGILAGGRGVARPNAN